MAKHPTTALIILAKAPAPGLVKTRLIPAIGSEGAAQLAQRLLEHTLLTARQCKAFTQLELCVSPSIDHPALTSIDLTSFVVTEQGDGDLGARMHRAFERALAQFNAAIMIGTDAPTLTAELLDQASLQLNDDESVFVPALDGGYALVGLTRLMPELFANMPWSTATVMQETRARLTALDARWHEFPSVSDIDEPDDLARLPANWRARWTP